MKQFDELQKVSENCILLENLINKGHEIICDITKWKIIHSENLELFATQLFRLERAYKWLTDSYNAIYLILDQFSSIYSKKNLPLLEHVHLNLFTKCLSNLVLKIAQLKQGFSQNRFIIGQKDINNVNYTILYYILSYFLTYRFVTKLDIMVFLMLTHGNIR